MEIVAKTRSLEERIFYIGLSLRERYTFKELSRQISSSLYERYILSQGKMTLVDHPKAELVPQVFRDRYVFDFLMDLPDPHDERDLQKALLAQIKHFVLELGRDFLFVGEEFPLQVGNRDFRIDLLFFHRELQCLVAFDLKMGEFQPEHLGKLGFYLEALDRDVRKPHENPSIGILLCKTQDAEVVEYAMSSNMSASLVAEYQLKLPDKRLLQEQIHRLLR
jgi:predicted nuclease of restriction endonuclease-like (RecB) superfamily